MYKIQGTSVALRWAAGCQISSRKQAGGRSPASNTPTMNGLSRNAESPHLASLPGDGRFARLSGRTALQSHFSPPPDTASGFSFAKDSRFLEPRLSQVTDAGTCKDQPRILRAQASGRAPATERSRTTHQAASGPITSEARIAGGKRGEIHPSGITDGGSSL